MITKNKSKEKQSNKITKNNIKNYKNSNKLKNHSKISKTEKKLSTNTFSEKKTDEIIKVEKYAMKLLTDKYNCTKNKYDSIILYHLINNGNCHLVCEFKEKMIEDFHEEFLKRKYEFSESSIRIPKFASYYKNYQKFFCKPTFNNFSFNKIIQTHGEKMAENYYKINYQRMKPKETNDRDFGFEESLSENSKFSSINSKHHAKDGNIFGNSTKEKIDDVSVMTTISYGINGTINLNMDNEKLEIFSENKCDKSNDTTLVDLMNIYKQTMKDKIKKNNMFSHPHKKSYKKFIHNYFYIPSINNNTLTKKQKNIFSQQKNKKTLKMSPLTKNTFSQKSIKVKNSSKKKAETKRTIKDYNSKEKRKNVNKQIHNFLQRNFYEFRCSNNNVTYFNHNNLNFNLTKRTIKQNNNDISQRNITNNLNTNLKTVQSKNNKKLSSKINDKPPKIKQSLNLVKKSRNNLSSLNKQSSMTSINKNNNIYMSNNTNESSNLNTLLHAYNNSNMNNGNFYTTSINYKKTKKTIKTIVDKVIDKNNTRNMKKNFNHRKMNSLCVKTENINKMLNKFNISSNNFNKNTKTNSLFKTLYSEFNNNINVSSKNKYQNINNYNLSGNRYNNKKFIKITKNEKLFKKFKKASYSKNKDKSSQLSGFNEKNCSVTNNNTMNNTVNNTMNINNYLNNYKNKKIQYNQKKHSSSNKKIKNNRNIYHSNNYSLAGLENNLSTKHLFNKVNNVNYLGYYLSNNFNSSKLRFNKKIMSPRNLNNRKNDISSNYIHIPFALYIENNKKNTNNTQSQKFLKKGENNEITINNTVNIKDPLNERQSYNEKLRRKIANILNSGKNKKTKKKIKNVKSIIKNSMSIYSTNTNNKDNNKDNIIIINDYQTKSVSNIFKNSKRCSDNSTTNSGLNKFTK